MTTAAALLTRSKPRWLLARARAMAPVPGASHVHVPTPVTPVVRVRLAPVVPIARARVAPRAVIAPRVAAAPRPLPLTTTVIELEDAFDDASLEMNTAGEKFRVAETLQAAVDDAGADAIAALAAAAAAQSTANAAQSTASAHGPDHQNGGAQEISVAGLSGVLADDQNASALRETGGPTLLTAGAVAALTLLRRSAASVLEGCTPGSFAHQAAPTSTMKLMLDDGGVVKHCTVGELLALVGSVAGSASNPFIDLPAAPNAFDDEFNGGNPDLAARAGGWIVRATGGAVLTRAGDINPWSATGPAAGTYWSTIVGSWVFIQCQPSTQVLIYKAITLAVGDSYFVRTGQPYRFDSSATARFQEVCFWQSSGGVPDNANRVYVSSYETSAAPIQLDFGRNVASAFNGTSRNRMVDVDIKGINYQASTNVYRCFGLNSNGGDTLTAAPTGGPAASGIAYFGLSSTQGAAGLTPSVLAIDFIRKKTGNAWVIP